MQNVRLSYILYVLLNIHNKNHNYTINKLLISQEMELIYSGLKCLNKETNVSKHFLQKKQIEYDILNKGVFLFLSPKC